MIVTNLLTNMMVLSYLIIPSNTPAFQKYAFHAMLTNAQHIAAQWHLDPASFATNKVTDFMAKPYVGGIFGSINFDRRYGFGYRNGRLIGFADWAEDSSFLSSDDKKRMRAGLKRWAGATNQLSDAQAAQVATAALKAIGLSPETIQSGKSPLVTQQAFDWKNERRPAPYYTVDWRSDRFSIVSMEVSGISGKVASFNNNSSFLRIATPTNYLEMLGLPPNTVFVRKQPPSPGRPTEYRVLQP